MKRSNGAMDRWEGFYYYVLGVHSSATMDEIKKAYQKLIKLCHPNRVGENEVLEARCKEITIAYSVLSDEKQRAEYDTLWSTRARGGGEGNYKKRRWNPDSQRADRPHPLYSPPPPPRYRREPPRRPLLSSQSSVTSSTSSSEDS